MIDTTAVSHSELPAHVAITNLIHRYAELVDAADFDGLGEMFAEGERVTPAETRRVALRLTALREPAAGDASEHLLQPFATRH